MFYHNLLVANKCYMKTHYCTYMLLHQGYSFSTPQTVCSINRWMSGSLPKVSSTQRRCGISFSSMTDMERQMTLDCRTMIDSAIQAVDPVTAVYRHVTVKEEGDDESTTARIMVGDQSFDLQKFDKIVLVAFGKASTAMTTAVVDRLALISEKNRPTIVGLVIAKDGYIRPEERTQLGSYNIVVHEAAHPVPDERSVTASTALLQLVHEHNDERTLVLACISGGGSSLFCTPVTTLTLEDVRDTNLALLQTGWNIHDMNVLRKRLERGKGGGLAKAAAKSTLVSLILSDVLGDPLDLIASGPTIPDSSTFAMAWQIVEEQWPKHLKLPPAVREVLRQGYEKEKEKGKTSEEKLVVFDRSYHVLVGNNAIAVRAAAEAAKRLGYHPIILSTQLQGEASTVARVMVGITDNLRHGSIDFSLVSPDQYPVALIAGGETTVTSSSSWGKGGRNQEFALTAALELQSKKIRQVVIASVGTDGSDGPTDAAGAIVDGGTVERLSFVVEESAEHAFQHHNAYPYLEHQDSAGISPLIKTGPTGTNVADVCIALIYERAEINDK